VWIKERARRFVGLGGGSFTRWILLIMKNKILSSWENQFFGLPGLLCPKPLPNTISVVGFYPNILENSCVNKREGKEICGFGGWPQQ